MRTALFAAEIDNLLLSTGHDLTALHFPLIADVTQEGEDYVGIGERRILVKAGDMCLRDGQGKQFSSARTIAPN